MVSVVAEQTGSCNFYDHLIAQAQLTSVGFAPGSRFTIKIETLDYDGSDEVGYDVFFRHDAPDEQSCFHASWITPSGNPRQTVTGDFNPPPEGVEWTGTSNATGCLDFTRIVVSGFCYKYPGTANLHFRVTLTYVPSTLLPAYCPYGSRAKAGTPLSEVVTPTNIELVLELYGASWAVQAFASIASRLLDIQALCGAGPTPGVSLDMSTWSASAVTLWETFKWAAWWAYCECIPGAGPAPMPPQPVITKPTNWPAAVTFSCDPAVICDALVKIQQQISGVQATARAALEMATLVQRYQLPMAIVRGATHSGLTDSGAFGISRLIGLELHIVGRSPDRPVLPGQPNYLWDMGWCSISDGSGMIQEKRITRETQLWIPPYCSMSDRFGYYLTAGTTMDVTEIEAEP